MKRKRCSKCGKRKLLSRFHKNKTRKDGLHCWCKICCAEYGKEYRRIHKDDSTFIIHRRAKALEYHSKRHSTLTGYLRHVCQHTKQRCNNPDDADYSRYGGIGVKYLFKSAKELANHIISDLGYDTLEKLIGLRLSRIDKTGHYERGNIYFKTISQCSHGNHKQRTFMSKRCSSRFKGVSFRKDRKKYRAYIKHDGEYIHLGHFTSEIEAAKAYDKKSVKLFGKFALTNRDLGLL